MLPSKTNASLPPSAEQIVDQHCAQCLRGDLHVFEVQNSLFIPQIATFKRHSLLIDLFFVPVFTFSCETYSSPLCYHLIVLPEFRES